MSYVFPSSPPVVGVRDWIKCARQSDLPVGLVPSLNRHKPVGLRDYRAGFHSLSSFGWRVSLSGRQGCSVPSPWHSRICSGEHSSGLPFRFSGFWQPFFMSSDRHISWFLSSFCGSGALGSAVYRVPLATGRGFPHSAGNGHSNLASRPARCQPRARCAGVAIQLPASRQAVRRARSHTTPGRAAASECASGQGRPALCRTVLGSV